MPAFLPPRSQRSAAPRGVASARAERTRTPEGVPNEADALKVFVVAPTGRDGRVAARVLEGVQAQAACYDRIANLPPDFPTEAGALLLTEEALTGDAPACLAERLQVQPGWSRLPVVLLTGEGPRSRAARRALRDACDTLAHVTTLERPLRASTLAAVMQTALQHRRRQYDVARLLSRLAEKSDTLEDEVADRTEALRKRGAQVRSLAEALTRAEQRERQRLSRVLHDHLQQLLYGMKVHAQMLRTTAGGDEGPGESSGSSPEERATLLDELDEVVNEAISLTRTLSIELNPPVLDEEGLPAALRWLAAQMRERHGLDVRLDTPADAPAGGEAQRLPTPGDELCALLFRLVRELLFNVVKHAGTGNATVALRPASASTEEKPPGALAITVADDGCGFDPETVQQTPTPGETHAPGAIETGLGLFSVRERLALFGGTMTLDTAPGEGTRVTLTVPVR